MCVRERERECVCVHEREMHIRSDKWGQSACVCVRERERERKCVRERDRLREGLDAEECIQPSQL